MCQNLWRRDQQLIVKRCLYYLFVYMVLKVCHLCGSLAVLLLFNYIRQLGWCCVVFVMFYYMLSSTGHNFTVVKHTLRFCNKSSDLRENLNIKVKNKIISNMNLFE
jgi:hypothetical protein